MAMKRHLLLFSSTELSKKWPIGKKQKVTLTPSSFHNYIKVRFLKSRITIFITLLMNHTRFLNQTKFTNLLKL
jgi:hypothetical protein